MNSRSWLLVYLSAPRMSSSALQWIKLIIYGIYLQETNSKTGMCVMINWCVNSLTPRTNDSSFAGNSYQTNVVLCFLCLHYISTAGGRRYSYIIALCF